ncbi:MAG: type II toxin-antitoxin system prevent-host-death family antitoxin [Pseudomonadota bacterium]
MTLKKTVSVSDFKAHCLEYVQTAQQQCQEYVITKRNVPVAMLVPLKEKKKFYAGYMKDSVKIHGDIMSPIDVEWDALKDVDWEALKNVD